MTTSIADRSYWSSRLAFVLAATGSAVGLGNIWKFPYVAGQHGGGSFVLTYLACIALIGLPLLIAEILIGRRGGAAPADSIARLARADHRSPAWRWAGTLGTVTAFLILTFYSVIGGWALSYLWQSLGGGLGADTVAIHRNFDELLASPLRLLGWHSLFMLVTAAVVAGGISRGIERAITIMMPALFVLLVLLLGYALTTDGIGASLEHLFHIDPGQFTTRASLDALGQAFFTLSLGMSVMIAYGAHLRRETSIPRAALVVIVLDTLVSLVVGVVIFAIAFSNQLDVGQGPGLIFQTLPLAFAGMGSGQLVAQLFFLLLLCAAWSSAISLLEPPVESLQARLRLSRPRAVALLGSGAWVIGILCALSFNLLSGFRPLGGMTLFELLDFLTSNLMLPLTGLCIALFAGWALSRSTTASEYGEGAGHGLWRWLIRYATPALVMVVFVYNLIG